DNMSQWVHRESKYERPFTESTDEWATYYDIIPDVARVKKPKDYHQKKVIFNYTLTSSYIDTLSPKIEDNLSWIMPAH
ncbi:MAG: hypothetical protein VZR28_10220, partial [Candidatus Cryptobacteroides sp.]|nr:hypothetical protein [Candidatus Cryptobacteroides sp.]